MSLQRHPVDSFKKELNFWEEFPDYKIHPIFGDFWSLNKKEGNLKWSSMFMWALSLCYDRKSSIFNQPVLDKWELVSEELFDDKNFMMSLVEDPDCQERLKFKVGGTINTMIAAFEESIDTPLGISLRQLEAKLIERTEFILSTKYTLDDYEEGPGGKLKLKKGTASQLDVMFANTAKITDMIQKTLDSLAASEAFGVTKGNEKESLSDGADDI